MASLGSDYCSRWMSVKVGPRWVVHMHPRPAIVIGPQHGAALLRIYFGGGNS